MSNCADYRQTDPKWSSIPYAGATVYGSGCGPTACADVIYSYDGKTTPADTARWAQANGCAANGAGTYWSGIVSIMKHFGMECQMINDTNLYGHYSSDDETEWKNKMATGNYYGILLMGPSVFTTGGHYICVNGWDGTNADIHDPYSPGLSKPLNWVNNIRGKVKVFYLIKKKNAKTSTTSTPKPATKTSYYKKCNSKYASIVQALSSIGVNSSYSNRAKIAKLNGISLYAGLPSQNIKMLNLLKKGKLIKSIASTTYYPKCASSCRTITEGMQNIHADCSYAYRVKIAAKNGIKGFSGTVSQNTTMLSLLKKGKLKRV